VPLERVRVTSIRCLSDVEVELDPRRNYLFGVNGAGKTSFLEAVYLLGRGRSFRTRQTTGLVQRGAGEFTVFGSVRQDGIRHALGVRFHEGRLEIQVDGRSGAGLVALAQALPVQVIDPQLHDLIDAGPSVRRRYLDGGVFHVEPTYLEAWRNYRRVLAQRNSALQRAVPSAEFAVWMEALAQAGAAVHAARERYCAALATAIQGIGERLVRGDVSLSYYPGWRKDLALAEALAASGERDRATGYTQVGPHRADIALKLEGNTVRAMASRGQQKLLAATLVLAQVTVFKELTVQAGTLLVDDPAAELDGHALERLLSELWTLDAQLVIAGISAAALSPPPGFPVFHVEQGQIRPML
jgi:DNA replication and repair protein RecF